MERYLTMNKTGFIKEISKQTGYDEERCVLINNVIENYFILGNKNKEKIIQDLKIKASLNEDEAQNVYDIIIKIIGTEIKNKLKHPFKSNNP
jgi:nucleoid DNA-binding protein